MNQLIDSRLSELDTQLHAFLAELRTFEPNHQKKPDHFILKLAYFLMRSEAVTFEALQEEIQRHNDSNSNTWESSLRIFFSRMSLRLTIPTKATIEAIKNESLPEKTSFWWVAKQWKEQRLRLKDLIRSLPEGSLNSKVLKHPKIGRLTIFDMLQYNAEYINWHKKHMRKMWN